MYSFFHSFVPFLKLLLRVCIDIPKVVWWLFLSNFCNNQCFLLLRTFFISFTFLRLISEKVWVFGNRVFIGFWALPEKGSFCIEKISVLQEPSSSHEMKPTSLTRSFRFYEQIWDKRTRSRSYKKISLLTKNFSFFRW